jgi:hypothetical protein
MLLRLGAVALSFFVVTLVAPRARADCNGPPECCIQDEAHVTVPLPEHVRVGLRLLRVNHVSERDGTFSGDVLILGRYPAGGIWPNFLVRNAGDTVNIVSDRIVRVGDYCYRAREITDTFTSWFRLRRFPFDRQNLQIVLEDDDFDPAQVQYEPVLWPNSMAQDAYRELESWKFTDYPRMLQLASTFTIAPGRPGAHLLVVEIPIERLWEFYITRYFLPLFLIVALAYGLFWIKPEDLGSASSIGITCMLAIIAFQLTQAGTLPQVEYLTLADRVYIVCYIATAVALGIAVWESHQASSDRIARALRVDRTMRLWFPIAFALMVVAAAAMGWRSHSDDPNADIPYVVPAAHPPHGESAIAP